MEEITDVCNKCGCYSDVMYFTDDDYPICEDCFIEYLAEKKGLTNEQR